MRWLGAEFGRENALSTGYGRAYQKSVFFVLRVAVSLPKLLEQCDGDNTPSLMWCSLGVLRGVVQTRRGETNAHDHPNQPSGRRASRSANRLGHPGPLPGSRSRSTLCTRCGTAQGRNHLPALPGIDAVRSRCTRQPCRVRRVGWHDGTSTPGVAQAAPRGGIMVRFLRSSAAAPVRCLRFGIGFAVRKNTGG
ncbi:WhiB-type transcription regulator [Rhodococcus wratislaviensis]|uniref:WhiB-type transcription regulator n=1 Tax=Rhodococcus wratislaviensis TaxID=44752 RepID=A0A402CBU0_RHOWR|nr:WhiB-type transcription regulator [Rhodococcus wratislaviensis]